MSKMKSLIKNGNFGQKRKFWSNVAFLVKRGILVKNGNFDQEWRIVSKI